MIVSGCSLETSAKELSPTRYGYLRKSPTLSKLNKRKSHKLLITVTNWNDRRLHSKWNI